MKGFIRLGKKRLRKATIERIREQEAEEGYYRKN